MFVHVDAESMKSAGESEAETGNREILKKSCSVLLECAGCTAWATRDSCDLEGLAGLAGSGGYSARETLFARGGGAGACELEELAGLAGSGGYSARETLVARVRGNGSVVAAPAPPVGGGENEFPGAVAAAFLFAAERV